jgi:hypothetical protein
MPNAFNNGRQQIDTKPFAPNSGGKTPYELARAAGLLGKWLVCFHKFGTERTAPGPCLCDPKGYMR